ncbi:hypothetical protein BZG36_01515 [Bifiguratus adelaidae]|uniref:Autophagy-related protein 18 n=1 Tax=Bifiguratus adelaidae TaxID=1938954 RepID=A0A261Y4W0_9FUNG|nr:hypothetical protein BZG36_01515 [Bifiguratus adelaidae]
MNLAKVSASSSPHDAPGLLYANFNQDYGCFSLGLESGFRIFNCDPLKEKMRKEFEDGGISIVEMLFRCNYLALVGGGRNPKYPPNKVMIWDDLKNKGIIELEFRSEVKNVKLRRDRIVVVLANKVFVYLFSATPQKLHVFETIDNDKGKYIEPDISYPHHSFGFVGLVSLSSSPNHAILAFPGRQRGHIQIADLNALIPTTSVVKTGSSNSVDASNGKSPEYRTKQQNTTNISIIAAHTGKLSCLSVNADGSKCASASEKGTLIRVFDTSTGKLLHELRRGVDRAEIYSIAFNSDSTRLCVSSDKGTVHIFNLDPAVIGDHEVARGPQYGEVTPSARLASPMPPGFTHSGNRGSSFSFMKDLLPKYFSSEWSFAHGRVVTETRCIAGFGAEKNTILVICADGSLYKFLFDPRRGGECTRESFELFLKDD